MVFHGPRQHPRQQEQQAGQKGHQARDRADGIVLHRGRDLHQADHDARDEADRKQRSAQPKRGHQGLADDLNYGIGCHQ
jgi:hypothetical protein